MRSCTLAKGITLKETKNITILTVLTNTIFPTRAANAGCPQKHGGERKRKSLAMKQESGSSCPAPRRHFQPLHPGPGNKLLEKWGARGGVGNSALRESICSAALPIQPLVREINEDDFPNILLTAGKGEPTPAPQRPRRAGAHCDISIHIVP